MTRIARTFLAASIAAALSAAILALPASSNQRPGATHAVLIKDFVFDPEVLPVQMGDTVIWTNRDIVPHTVTAQDGSWDSGEIAAGETWTMIITDDFAGSYFCVYHPGMQSKVEVAPS